MGFLSDKFEARKYEKLVREMRERASITTETFKRIYVDWSKAPNGESRDTELQSMVKTKIEAFLIRVFREETKQESEVPVLDVSEETIRDLVRYASFSHSFDSGVNAGHLVAWAQNMNETVRAGRLVTMPGATVESSRGYRALLHANAICKDMGWDWNSTENSERSYADHAIALVVGDLMVSIFDKYGLDSEVGFAGQFGSILLNLWNISVEREGLRK